MAEHWAAQYRDYKGGTLEWWLYLTACYVQGTESQAREVAEIAKRDNCGVWHACAVYFGTVPNCACGPCVKSRKSRKSP